MYISYIIYIILNSRCYTGVRAPKLSHRSSYIKEPFGKGLDGLPGGWMGAWEGLEGGLRSLRPVQGGFKEAWEGLQGGLRRASRGLEKGFKGAWEGLQGAWRWLAWRGLQGGFKGAWEGLQGGFKVKGASRWRGLQGGFKGAWEGLEKGFKGASRGLEKGFKGASRGLQGGFKPFSPSCPPPGRDPSSLPWRVPSKVVARIQPHTHLTTTSSGRRSRPRGAWVKSPRWVPWRAGCCIHHAIQRGSASHVQILQTPADRHVAPPLNLDVEHVLPLHQEGQPCSPMELVRTTSIQESKLHSFQALKRLHQARHIDDQSWWDTGISSTPWGHRLPLTLSRETSNAGVVKDAQLWEKMKPYCLRSWRRSRLKMSWR